MLQKNKSVIDVLDPEKYVELTKPTSFNKFSGRESGHRRLFRVDVEKGLLLWKSPRKSERKSAIPFDAIKEISEGRGSERFKRAKAPVDDEESRSFSIIYSGKRLTLDLVADNKEIYATWIKALKELVQITKAGDPINRFLHQAWKHADRNSDGKLDLSEIEKLLKELNTNFSKSTTKAKFDLFQENGHLTFDQFTKFYKDLRYRGEIESLFNEYARSDGRIHFQQFKNFLESSQQCFFSDEKIHELITINEIEDFSYENNLSLDGFSRFLHSEECSIWKKEHVTKYQDMDQPLTHYWINSSHNTYLTGDQLKSKSSTDAYVNAFQKGCRCVELDCWDGPDGNPIIYHGHTLTSKILFEDVIKTVKKYAFEVSEYPVILSLEVHCSVPQQDKMAEILVQHLGDMIATTPLAQGQEFLPSPESLKKKILIKGKALPKGTKPEEYDTEEEEEDDDENEPEEAKQIKQAQGHHAKGVPPPKTKVSQKLSDLVVYCKTAGFKTFEDCKEKQKADQMSSFSEGKSTKIATNQREEFIEYNRRQLSRIYPAGGRVDSSNYDPHLHWNAGCQIVAFNFQTLDRTMQLNLGKFHENGKAGYLLKPEWMRNPEAKKATPKKLTVQVISAQQLPKPNQSKKGEIIDPYVAIDICGEPSDCVVKKTKHIENNGWNPNWIDNPEIFEFSITTPEITLVRFVVFDKDLNEDDFIASATVNFQSLGLGYRHIKLADSNNNLLHLSTIFVKIQIEDA